LTDNIIAKVNKCVIIFIHTDYVNHFYYVRLRMIQGIGFSPDMYSAYNRIQIAKPEEDKSLQSLAGQAGNLPASTDVSGEVVAPKEMDLRLDDIRPRTNVSIEDISLSLNESASNFEMKGRESDITSLDMEKAVSDMKRDQSLMQYQYFVGEANPFSSSADGIVIAK